jgi:hypothetical protein
MDTDGKTTVHLLSRIVRFYPCGSVFIRGSLYFVFGPKVRKASDVFDPKSLSVVSFADRVACTLPVHPALVTL